MMAAHVNALATILGVIMVEESLLDLVALLLRRPMAVKQMRDPLCSPFATIVSSRWSRNSSPWNHHESTTLSVALSQKWPRCHTMLMLANPDPNLTASQPWNHLTPTILCHRATVASLVLLSSRWASLKQNSRRLSTDCNAKPVIGGEAF